MHYKAPDNSLHFIEPEYEHLLPAGCVQITQEEADALRSPAPTSAQLQASALAQVRALREPVLNALVGIGFAAMADGDAGLVSQIATTRQAILDITKTDVSSCHTASEFAAAYKAAWVAIATAAPASVVVAFNVVVA